jgi:hypothetical protein
MAITVESIVKAAKMFSVQPKGSIKVTVATEKGSYAFYLYRDVLEGLKNSINEMDTFLSSDLSAGSITHKQAADAKQVAAAAVLK